MSLWQKIKQTFDLRRNPPQMKEMDMPYPKPNQTSPGSHSLGIRRGSGNEDGHGTFGGGT